ncbi:MAG: hypothetical protein AMJ46_11490 [Latescibacteria bacterium DG_63]|nr:MAG: hypothetical protein AMJ46_11490 [Latescibacteria bacterium DG_63]
MRLLLTLAASVALASLLVVLAGCSGDSSSVGTAELSPEQQDIQALLEASEYALPEAFHSDEEYQVQDGSSLTQYCEEGEDVLPWVRFFRVMRGRPWNQYIIRIPGSGGPGTADVKILQHISGAFVVDNTDDAIINPFYRRLGSIAVTHFMLNKLEGVWRIAKISPTDIVSTNDGGTTIHIEGIRTQGSSRTYPQTIIMSADSLLALDRLPAFAPGDTVMVAAKALNRNEDGSWLFLHVHCAHHASFFHGWVPFVRDDSDPTMFYARWILPPGVATPRVFHMAVDAIDWNTLFGDETAVYNSRIWSVPCVLGFSLLVEK